MRLSINNLLAGLLFLTLACPQVAQAAQDIPDTRKPLIYGISAKPFPAISGLDYSFCRAEAWINSLLKADEFLPALPGQRLKLPGPDPALARLALCALASPLDVVTPPNAPGNEIRVFRKWPDDIRSRCEAVLAKPWIVELEMAIIWETSQAVSDLRQIWPDSVAAAGKDADRLDQMRRLLEDLWRAAEFNEDANDGKERFWGAAFSGASDSAAVLLAMGQEDPASRLEPLEKALSLFMRREVNERKSAELWRRLVSRGLYLRGFAHQNGGQAALAQADYDAALARLATSGSDSLSAAIHVARAELKRQAGDHAAMCADLDAACGLGQCGPLSQARRAGACLGGGQ